jgi:hypothetical protein
MLDFHSVAFTPINIVALRRSCKATMVPQSAKIKFAVGKGVAIPDPRIPAHTVVKF